MLVSYRVFDYTFPQIFFQNQMESTRSQITTMAPEDVYTYIIHIYSPPNATMFLLTWQDFHVQMWNPLGAGFFRGGQDAVCRLSASLPKKGRVVSQKGSSKQSKR